MLSPRRRTRAVQRRLGVSGGRRRSKRRCHAPSALPQPRGRGGVPRRADDHRVVHADGGQRAGDRVPRDRRGSEQPRGPHQPHVLQPERARAWDGRRPPARGACCRCRREGPVERHHGTVAGPRLAPADGLPHPKAHRHVNRRRERADAHGVTRLRPLLCRRQARLRRAVQGHGRTTLLHAVLSERAHRNADVHHRGGIAALHRQLDRRGHGWEARRALRRTRRRRARGVLAARECAPQRVGTANPQPRRGLLANDCLPISIQRVAANERNMRLKQWEVKTLVFGGSGICVLAFYCYSESQFRFKIYLIWFR